MRNEYKNTKDYRNIVMWPTQGLETAIDRKGNKIDQIPSVKRDYLLTALEDCQILPSSFDQIAYVPTGPCICFFKCGDTRNIYFHRIPYKHKDQEKAITAVATDSYQILLSLDEDEFLIAMPCSGRYLWVFTAMRGRLRNQIFLFVQKWSINSTSVYKHEKVPLGVGFESVVDADIRNIQASDKDEATTSFLMETNNELLHATYQHGMARVEFTRLQKPFEALGGYIGISNDKSPRNAGKLRNGGRPDLPQIQIPQAPSFLLWERNRLSFYVLILSEKGHKFKNIVRRDSEDFCIDSATIFDFNFKCINENSSNVDWENRLVIFVSKGKIYSFSLELDKPKVLPLLGFGNVSYLLNKREDNLLEYVIHREFFYSADLSMKPDSSINFVYGFSEKGVLFGNMKKQLFGILSTPSFRDYLFPKLTEIEEKRTFQNS